MKKNLRIASAAAAALLAVAPVAASVVDTTFADTTVTYKGDGKTATTPYELGNTGRIFAYSQATGSYTDLNSQEAAKVLDIVKNDEKYKNHTSSLSLGTPTVASVTGLASNGTYTQTLAVPVLGATQTKTKNGNWVYKDSKGMEVTVKPNDNTIAATKSTQEGLNHVGANVGSQIEKGQLTPVYDAVKTLGTVYVSRTVQNVTQQGTLYFFDKVKAGQPVVSGTASLDEEKVGKLSNGFTAQDLLNLIESEFGSRIGDSSRTTTKITTTASDVYTQLVAQGLKTTANGGFDYPSTGFNVKVDAQAIDNPAITGSLTVRVNPSFNVNFPTFVQTVDKQVSKRLHNGATAPMTVKVALNGDVAAAIKKAVVAYVSANSNNQINLTVDSSAVNNAAVGLYTATVSATNPAGQTSKINVNVQVGNPGEVSAYVANDGVKVYTINGNTVTESTKTLTKGTAVVAYGKVTINGVEYSRISKDDNSEWVKSSDLTATAPVAETTTTRTINHVAKIYDKDGKPTSEAKLHAYDSVSVVKDPVTINGAKYYKLAGKDQYVKAGNIDGTSRTLSHNAYVYKNTGKASTVKSGKKTVKKLLKKGASVTTYGSAFNINGHKMYRIGKNQYVKVANF